MDREQAQALRKPFPKESIGKLPKAGMQLDFVGHAAVTDRLLAVDPEWTWEPLALDEHGLPMIDRFGGLWIKLTVAGVTRLGYGEATGKQPNAQTVKELIGDALKNAAMRFGVALDLWSKEELEGSHADQSWPPAQQPWPEPADTPASKGMPPFASAKQIAFIGTLLRKSGVMEPAESWLAGPEAAKIAGRDMAGRGPSADEASAIITALKTFTEIPTEEQAKALITSTLRMQEDDPWAVPADQAIPMSPKAASGKQLAMIRAIFGELKTPREDQVDITFAVTNHQVQRLEELTSKEASQLLDHLQALKGEAA